MDAFVFPTKYNNEAEPLVVWEALAAGIPVIAYDRGCIQRQVALAGKIIPKENDFVTDSLTVLHEWMIHPAIYRNIARIACEQYQSSHFIAMTQWVTLLKNLRQMGI